MTETIVLDAAGIAGPHAARHHAGSPRDGPNWGDAEIQAYIARPAVGSSPVDYRLPNRIINIPLMLRTFGATTFATIRQQPPSEGRTVPTRGRVDHAAGRRHPAVRRHCQRDPASRRRRGCRHTASADIDAVLTFECIPDWYGDETTLSDHVETTLPHLFFTESDGQRQPPRPRPPRCRQRPGDRPARPAVGIPVAQLQRGDDRRAVLRGRGAGAAQRRDRRRAVRRVRRDGGVPFAIAAGEHVGADAANRMVGGTTALDARRLLPRMARCYAPGPYPPIPVPVGRRRSVGPADQRCGATSRAPRRSTCSTSARSDSTRRRSARDNGPASSKPTRAGRRTIRLAVDNIYFQPLDEPPGSSPTTSRSPRIVGRRSETPPAPARRRDARHRRLVNPANAPAADSASRERPAQRSGRHISHCLKAPTFGFAIPSTATIAGIQVDVARHRARPAAACVDYGVRARQGRDRSRPATGPRGTSRGRGSETVRTYGGPTDLWGNTWTASDINNSGSVSRSRRPTPSAWRHRARRLHAPSPCTTRSRPGSPSPGTPSSTPAKPSSYGPTACSAKRRRHRVRPRRPTSSATSRASRRPGSKARHRQVFLKASRGEFDQLARLRDRRHQRPDHLSPELPGDSVTDRPPLQLHVDRRSPGRHHPNRWGIDEPDPENVPSAPHVLHHDAGRVRAGSLTLPRQPAIDYPDLAEFSTVTVRGAGGQVAWQGRLETTPRTSGRSAVDHPRRPGGRRRWMTARTRG